MEALGETVEALCVLACGPSVREQTELAGIPGLEVEVVQVREHLAVNLQRNQISD